MAIVIRRDPDPIKLPGLTMRAYEIDFDSSYPTGGEAWADLDDDFDVIKGAIFESKAGYEFELTSKDAPASSLIKVYRTGTVTPAGTNAVPTFTGSELDPATVIKRAVIQGGAAGNYSVNGVESGDTIIAVLQLNSIPDATSSTQQVADVIDLTSEFAVAATSTISNAGGTSTSSNDELLVLFAKPYTPTGAVAAPTFTGTATTAAALAETGAATNLSTVTKVGVLVWGKKS